MIRATVWTVGLFGAGTALVHAFPGTWTEPLVLLALGLALLFASAPRRSGARRRPARVVPVGSASAAAATIAAPAPLAAPAAAPVEHTA